jgi:hypothetical protein
LSSSSALADEDATSSVEAASPRTPSSGELARSAVGAPSCASGVPQSPQKRSSADTLASHCGQEDMGQFSVLSFQFSVSVISFGIALVKAENWKLKTENSPHFVT